MILTTWRHDDLLLLSLHVHDDDLSVDILCLGERMVQLQQALKKINSRYFIQNSRKMHTFGHANLVKYTSFKIRYLWRTGATLYCAGPNINLTCTESRGFSLSRLSPPFLLFFGFGSFPPGIARYVSLSENYERNVKKSTLF